MARECGRKRCCDPRHGQPAIALMFCPAVDLSGNAVTAPPTAWRVRGVSQPFADSAQRLARERGRHAAFRAADFTTFLPKETALLRRTATAVDPTVEAMRAVPKPAALVLAEATNPPRSSTSATRARCWSTVPSAEHRYRATRVENIWRCGHCTIGSPRPYARADSGHDDHIAGHRGELHRLTKVDLGFALVHRGWTTLAKMRLQLEV